MHKASNPSWWNSEHDSRWEKVKAAFRRDWEQTKNDLGSDLARDLQQSASDTVKQAAGSQPIPRFDELEPAFRYGHGARAYYKDEPWSSSVEEKMAKDYSGDWKRDRDHVRRGYDYPSNI